MGAFRRSPPAPTLLLRLSLSDSFPLRASPPAALAAMKLPPMLYGTAWKKDRTTDLVVSAVSKGFRGVDTACQPKVASLPPSFPPFR